MMSNMTKQSKVKAVVRLNVQTYKRINSCMYKHLTVQTFERSAERLADMLSSRTNNETVILTVSKMYAGTIMRITVLTDDYTVERTGGHKNIRTIRKLNNQIYI